MSGAPATASRILSGIVVVDLSQGIAGPYASGLMAELGATVLKVEPDEGDWLRAVGPPTPHGAGGAFVQLNRGKQSLVLDLTGEAGWQTVTAMAARADVLLHEMPRDRAAAVGFSADAVAGRFPRLIACAVTPLGDVGPWADRPVTELEIQAISGLTRFLGRIGEEPVRIGADVGGILGGNAAFQAIIAALFEREHSGLGQSVSVSQLGSLYAVSSLMLAAIDGPDAWHGFHCVAATNPPDHGIRTRDGALLYGQPLRSEEAWVRFCRMIGAEALLDDPRFATRHDRQPRLPELRRALEPYFESRSTAELMAAIEETEGTGAPLNSYTDLAAHPQSKAMGIIREVDHLADGGGAVALSPPWRFRNEEDPSPPGRAPALGEHTDELAEVLGFAGRGQA